AHIIMRLAIGALTRSITFTMSRQVSICTSGWGLSWFGVMHALICLFLACFVLKPASVHCSESCVEHFTCKSNDRTMDYLQVLRLNSSVPNWYDLCNCDSYCHIFGDCCADAPVLSQLRLDEWSFVKIR